MADRRPTRMRWWLLAALLIGLVGSAVELVFLGHYEDAWQIAPIALIAVAIGLLAWHLVRPTDAIERILRGTMALFVAAGLTGVALHMEGAAEFQREIDPTIHGWALFTKVLHAKAPPALAPGLMIQLGLLGLAFTLTSERESTQ